MAKKTVLEEVKARMKDMQDSKAAQLETIRQKQIEARNQIETATLAMKQATEEMNVDSYEEAKNAKRKAQTALDMYNGRYDQIRQQEYISETESDSVIDSLLEYEAKLAEDFKAATAERLQKLAELLKTYTEEVADTEYTLLKWQQDIHANYSTRGGSYFRDENTGATTDRSPHPVPVHRLPYKGCSEAHHLGEYLKKVTALYEGNLWQL